MEFQRLIPNPVKIKHYIEDEEFVYNKQLAAVLKNNNNSTPILEIYSDDPDIIGRARGNLLALDYLELRRKYSPVLFLNAQLRKGPVFQDAIKTINQRICAREIDIEYKLVEFHQFLLEANKKLIKNNLSLSSALQDAPINIDELRAYNHFPDDFKGNLACSVFLPEMGKDLSYDIVSNFDWPSAGILFKLFKAFIYRINVMDSSKPQYVFSWTLPTNPGFRATNGHIVLAMNEVEIAEAMRRNPKGGLGQFDLFYQLLANCRTREEMEAYIKDHPPASPCILIYSTKNDSGIIELLPRSSEENYRFLNAEEGCVITNHFQNMPETATISCSVPRQKKMENAAKEFADNPEKIAASSATYDTGQTLIGKWTEEGLVLRSNIANYNSAIAKDPDFNELRYDEINITKYGEEFLKKCNENLVRSVESKVDKQLLELCRSAYKVKDENISQCMRNIYSQLMFEKSKLELIESKELNAASSLTLKDIENIAVESNSIANLIMDTTKLPELKLKALDQYEKTISNILDQQLNDSTNYLKTMLGFAVFTGMLAMFYTGFNGLELAKTGLSWLINNISAAYAISSISTPLINSFKTSPDLAFFTQAMTKQLKAQINIENVESRQLKK